MKHSDSLAKISPALVTAQGELEGVRKDAENEGFKRGGKASTYATLAACIEASREILAANRLCVIQGPGATNTEDKTLTVTTRIMHESGEWIETDFDMPLTKWSPHEAGSATTYGRRIALMAMLGLAPVEDDDGNAASGLKVEKNPNVSVDNGGPDWWGASGNGELSAYAIKKNHPEVAKEFDEWMGLPDHIHTAAEWKEWCGKNDEAIKRLPKSWRQELRAVFEIRGKELGAIQ